MKKMTENSESEIEKKSDLQGMMDEAEVEEDERKEVSTSSLSYGALSGSQLCCRSGRLITGECVHPFRSIGVCACVSHMFPKSGDHRGLTDYLSRCRVEGFLSPSLSLSCFPQSLTAGSLYLSLLKVTATLRKFGRYTIPGA